MNNGAKTTLQILAARKDIGAIVITPIVLGDQVLCASGRNNAGLTLLKIIGPGKGQQATEQYFQKLNLNQFQDNLLVLDGYVYGTTRYGLFCAELAGPFVKGSFTIPDAQPSAGATHPVIAGGCCFLRDNQRLFCYDVRNITSNELPPVARTIKLDFARKEVPAKKEVPARIGEGSDATKTRTLRSVFVPTPQDVVDRQLELAELKRTDVVFDLGSGDGRIVISAARKFGCRAVVTNSTRILSPRRTPQRKPLA